MTQVDRILQIIKNKHLAFMLSEIKQRTQKSDKKLRGNMGLNKRE